MPETQKMREAKGRTPGAGSPAARPERCRDIMTENPICCLPRDSVTTAARLMMEHDIGLLPVVTSRSDKDVVGVITDRDIALAVVARGADPVETKVESVMSRHPLVCSPDDAYQKVVLTAARRHVRRMPVVDYSGRLLGIVSQADVALRIRDRRQTADFIREVSKPAE